MLKRLILLGIEQFVFFILEYTIKPLSSVNLINSDSLKDVI